MSIEDLQLSPLDTNHRNNLAMQIYCNIVYGPYKYVSPYKRSDPSKNF